MSENGDTECLRAKLVLRRTGEEVGETSSLSGKRQFLVVSPSGERLGWGSGLQVERRSGGGSLLDQNLERSNLAVIAGRNMKSGIGFRDVEEEREVPVHRPIDREVQGVLRRLVWLVLLCVLGNALYTIILSSSSLPASSHPPPPLSSTSNSPLALPYDHASLPTLTPYSQNWRKQSEKVKSTGKLVHTILPLVLNGVAVGVVIGKSAIASDAISIAYLFYAIFAPFSAPSLVFATRFIPDILCAWAFAKFASALAPQWALVRRRHILAWL